MNAGTPATAPAVMDLAEQHRHHLERWFHDCDYDVHRQLAAVYLANERLGLNFDDVAPGLSRYIHDTIIATPTERRSAARPCDMQLGGLVGGLGHDEVAFVGGQAAEGELSSSTAVAAFDPGDDRDAPPVVGVPSLAAEDVLLQQRSMARCRRPSRLGPIDPRTRCRPRACCSFRDRKPTGLNLIAATPAVPATAVARRRPRLVSSRATAR